jgi:chromosome segregation ATPase
MTYIQVTMNLYSLLKEFFSLKKRFAASILVGSLLFGHASVGAQEVLGLSTKNQLQTQDDLEKKRLEQIKAEIEVLKEQINKVLEEVKPLRKKMKDLLEQLKSPKVSKDKQTVKQIKDKIASTHELIKMKLVSIEDEMEELKKLQMELMNMKTQPKKPNLNQKVSTSEKVRQLKQKLNLTIQEVKEFKKQGNRAEAEKLLVDAFQLAEQISNLKYEILAQKQRIG